MKVFYIIPTCKGGMLHYSSQLINSINSNINHKTDKILVIANNYNSNLLSSNIKFKKINLSALNYLEAFIQIRSYIKKENPDIIHLLDFHYLFVPLIPIFNKCMIIITAHDVNLHPGNDTFLNRILLKIYLKLGRHIIVHGELMKKQLLNKGYKAENISIIPIGNFGFFKNFKPTTVPAKEPDSILFFGNILPYKGLIYLIKAMKNVNKIYPNQKLVIAGEGDISSYLSIIENLNINVEIINRYIPDEEVHIYFESAICVVLPYIEASQTGIIPIAYSFKKPVVVTNVGSIPDVVKDGITGFVVPSKDENALSESIIKLLNDIDLQKEMGENAYRISKEDFSWDQIARKTIELYKFLREKNNEGN